MIRKLSYVATAKEGRIEKKFIGRAHRKRAGRARCVKIVNLAGERVAKSTKVAKDAKSTKSAKSAKNSNLIVLLGALGVLGVLGGADAGLQIHRLDSLRGLGFDVLVEGVAVGVDGDD